ncbi:hypothetical protein RRSWK_00510 [Rhodopirellula sp. SWK7]|nr:hypothetical protein RRSWK_00510 [Rhodopirellula sp. SWK7]
MNHRTGTHDAIEEHHAAPMFGNHCHRTKRVTSDTTLAAYFLAS